MSEPWSGTTKEVLQEKARLLGVSESGTREELYHRIEQTLREKVLQMDTTDEEAELIREAQAARAGLAIVPTVDDVMDEWHAGVVEPVSTLPEFSRWEQMRAMAAVLCTSALMPAHIRNSRDREADCLVTLLAAHDLGLTSTLAFQKIHVIEGRPSLAADLMRVLIQRDGHDIKIGVTKDNTGVATAAEVLINRKEWRDDDWRGAEFTIVDARNAGLASKSNWKGWTEDMLVARATSRAARRYCSDSLGGISYTPEELGAIDTYEATGDAEPPAPEPEPLGENRRAQVSFLIAGLDESQREWLAEQWKQRGVPSLHPKRADAAPLTEEWMPTITALIDEAAAQPTDAHVVDDGPTGVMVPGPVGETMTVGDPTVDPATKVEALRESIESSDAKLDDSKEGRAMIARQVLAEAKAKAEAAGVVDPTCPDCGRPMREDNKQCKTHPM